MLFLCGFAAGCSCLGVGGDGAVGVEAADGAVALLKDAVALFQHGLDVLDELLFVEFLLGCAIGSLNALSDR